MNGRADDEQRGPDEHSSTTDTDRTIVSSTRSLEATARRIATLVVVQGPEIGRHYPLRRNKSIIGRGDEADILIRHKEMSRSHARIDCLRLGDDTLYRLVDLGSTNHVFVNGERVDGHVLADGDKVHLGDVVLKFELHDAIDAKFHDEIRTRISYDDLTGLLTYESFRTALAWELERYTSAQGCAVVMMDLDDFKKLNDTWGHLAGSFVLREVGSLIGGNMRYFDVASRYGGEEFVAYLPDTGAEEAILAADRLRKLLERHVFHHEGRDIRLTISMGVAHFPDDGSDLDSLVRAADERLYLAKRTGKNRVCGGEGAATPAP